MRKDHDVIQVPLTVEIIEEETILKRAIGFVQHATTTTSLGELNATVVEKRRMGTSRPTNPQDGTTTVQISDVSDLVKKIMVETIGNALHATTTTSRSEWNAIAVENQSQVVEAMIVHVVAVTPTDVEVSVEIEMGAEVLVEIVEAVILTVVVEAETVDEASEEIEEVVIPIVVVEAETVDEASEEIEEVVIPIVVVEAEVVVMIDVIQDEVVQIETMIVQMSAIEKQEESVQVMHTIEDHSQFVHVAIKAKTEMIEVNA